MYFTFSQVEFVCIEAFRRYSHFSEHSEKTRKIDAVYYLGLLNGIYSFLKCFAENYETASEWVSDCFDKLFAQYESQDDLEVE